MITVYPVVFTTIPEGFMAYVPDLEINTHGKDLGNAIEMSRDAISLWCVSQQDEGQELPIPSQLSAIEHQENDIVTLVDADINAYRRSLESKAIKKTLTLPSWLNEKAERAGINFSKTLQKALKEELQITE